MLWILQTALLVPEVRRLRPFGFGFGHSRLVVLLVIILIAAVIALISRHNRR